MGGLSIWHWIVVLLVVALVLLIAISIRNTRRRRAAIARGEIAEPRGVGGWLLFYCVVITVIFPLRTAVSLIQAYGQHWSEFGSAPRLDLAVYFDVAVQAGLVALALWAGTSLWKIWPAARQRNKIFLRSYLLVMVVEPFLFLAIANLPEQAADQVQTSWLSNAGSAAIWFAIWWSYFKVSKRVHNTYGGAAAIPPVPQPAA